MCHPGYYQYTTRQYTIKVKATKLRNVYVVGEMYNTSLSANILMSLRNLLQCLRIKYITKRYTHSNN